MSQTRTRSPTTSMRLSVDDNRHLTSLLGVDDGNLRMLERTLGVEGACRGNQIVLTGSPSNARRGLGALEAMLGHVRRNEYLDAGMIRSILDSATRRNGTGAEAGDEERLDLRDLPAIRTKRGIVNPRTPGQTAYAAAMASNEMVFGVGPAGTGKTYLAVAHAVAMLQSNKVDRIILSRPAVEAGERLGFLPGDLKEKIDPYLRPLYDALHDMMPGDQVIRRMGTGEIEVAPLAFMRGRTLSHAFVILDEAQNTTPVQMKMFLTRMGEGTRMVVTGDLSQIDLPSGQRSGLRDAMETLAGVEGVGICEFRNADVVRHPLVGRILDAYDARK